MENSTTAHELRIRFNDHKAEWIGTRAQLEAEGFIPEATQWPTNRRYTRVDTPAAWFCLYRHKPDGTEPTVNTLYKLHHYSKKNDCRPHAIEKKLREVHDLLRIGSPQWSAEIQQYYKARGDDAFQVFKRALLGQKKRGRPAKNITSSTQSQGASA